MEGFRKWCSRVPAVKTVLTGLLANIGRPAEQLKDPQQQYQPAHQQQLLHTEQQQQQDGSDGSGSSVSPFSHPTPPKRWLQLPEVVTGGAAAFASGDAGGLLLRPEWVWLLAPALPPDLRQEWRLVFSSAKHGMSFNTFVGRLGEAAPTLLLVRDKGGHVFGGVAFAPWRRNGSFYGEDFAGY